MKTRFFVKVCNCYCVWGEIMLSCGGDDVFFGYGYRGLSFNDSSGEMG